MPSSPPPDHVSLPPLGRDDNPLSPLSATQRINAIAAALAVDVSHWPLGVPEAARPPIPWLSSLALHLDASMSGLPHLSPSQRLDASSLLLAGLAAGSMTVVKDAYLALLPPSQPDGHVPVTAMNQTSTAFRRMVDAAVDAFGARLNGVAAPLATMHALARLFVRAVDTPPGALLAIDTARMSNRDVIAGVHLELFGTLRRLHDLRLIGRAVWSSPVPLATGIWRRWPGGGHYSNDDLRPVLWRTWAFDPGTGFRTVPARGFDAAPVDPAAPLLGLAVLAPHITQLLNPRTGTIHLRGDQDRVHLSAFLSVGAQVPLSGASDEQSAALRGRLAEMDLIVCALIGDDPVPDATRLPLLLRRIDDRMLTDSDVEIAVKAPDGSWRLHRGRTWPPAPDGVPAMLSVEDRGKAIMERLFSARDVQPSRFDPELKLTLLNEAWGSAFAGKTNLMDGAQAAGVSATLLAGILDNSPQSLLRVQTALRDQLRRAGKPDAVRRAIFRNMLNAACDALQSHPDPRVAADSVDGQVMGELFAELMGSSEQHPVRLDLDALMDGLSGREDFVLQRRYVEQVMAMHDDIDALSRAGVLGPVEFTTRQAPSDGRWQRSGNLWTTRDDLLAMHWLSGVRAPTPEASGGSASTAPPAMPRDHPPPLDAPPTKRPRLASDPGSSVAEASVPEAARQPRVDDTPDSGAVQGSFAMDHLIASWMETQLPTHAEPALTGMAWQVFKKNPFKDRALREALSAWLPGSSVDMAGLLAQMDLGMEDPSTSSAMLLVSLDETLRRVTTGRDLSGVRRAPQWAGILGEDKQALLGLRTTSPGDPWNIWDTRDVLEMALTRLQGMSGGLAVPESGVRLWQLRMTLLAGLVDSARNRTPFYVDLDLMRQWRDDPGAQDLARTVFDACPLLDALQRQAVIEPVRVLSQKPTEGGRWHATEHGMQESRQRLYDILDAQGWTSEIGAARINSMASAFPGLSARLRSQHAKRRSVPIALKHADGRAVAEWLGTQKLGGAYRNGRERQRNATYTWELGAVEGALERALSLDVELARVFPGPNDALMRTLPRHLHTRGSKDIHAGGRELSWTSPASARSEGPGGAPLFRWNGHRHVADGDTLRAFDHFLTDVDSTGLAERPLSAWTNELPTRLKALPAWRSALAKAGLSGSDGAPADLEDGAAGSTSPPQADKRPLLLLIQLDDSPASLQASLRYFRKHGDRVVWIQADRGGRHEQVPGSRALTSVRAEDTARVVVVGRGSTSEIAQVRLVSRYSSTALGQRVGGILKTAFGDRLPRLTKATVVSCATANTFSFHDFTRSFYRSFNLALPASATTGLKMTFYSDLLIFPDSDPHSTRRYSVPTGTWQAVRRAAGTTWIAHGKQRNMPDVDDKYAGNAQPVATLSPDDTWRVMDTAMDAGLTDASAPWESERVRTSLELAFEHHARLPDDEPSWLLRTLFTDEHGRFDARRLRRIAAEPVERDLLLTDLEDRMRTDGRASDPLRPGQMLEGSLAGLGVPLAGQDIPASLLACLGAQIDGRPIDARTVKAVAAGTSTEAWSRLSIDADRLGQWLSLLPDEAGGKAVPRTRALGTWLGTRLAEPDTGSPFVAEPSRRAADQVARLTAISGGDQRSRPDGAEFLRRVRAPADTASPPLLDEIVAALSTDTRAGFDDWIRRTGLQIDDLPPTSVNDVGNASSDPTSSDETPLGKAPLDKAPFDTVLDDIARSAEHGDVPDIDALLRVTADRALFDLKKLGLVVVADQGVQLDGRRLQALFDRGKGRRFALACRAFQRLPESTYRQLRALAPPELQSRLASTRGSSDLPHVPGRPARVRSWAMDGSIDVVDTVVGVMSLVQGWHQMTPTMRGLTITQAGSIVISPALMQAGEALSRLGPVQSLKVSRMLCNFAKGGGGNVAIATLGLATSILQWLDFARSGRSLDSFEGKSLIAGTTMNVLSFAQATLGAVIGVKVAVAGGSAAALGTGLGVASAILGKVAFPLAIAMMLAGGMTSVLLWNQEFGRFLRQSMTIGEQIEAVLAKMFGLSTDATLRAEMEKLAREASADMVRRLNEEGRDLLTFRADILSKRGFDAFMLPDVWREVKHATFKDNQPKDSSQPFTFVLQPQDDRWDGGLQRHTRERLRPDLPAGTAWVALRQASPWALMKALDEEDMRDRQWFELGGAGANVRGGPEADTFHVDRHSLVCIDGGSNDEVRMDAQGADVDIAFTPGGKTGHWTFAMDFGSQPGGGGFTRVNDVHRIQIRDARHAAVRGSDKDDRFDVSAGSAAIHGMDGRNHYVLRSGNRVFSTSDDVALWARDVSAAIDVGGERPASLLIRVDVPHEALSFRREDAHLIVSTGDGALTLERYFSPPAGTRPGNSSFSIVDAFGTFVTLMHPGSLGSAAVPATRLDKALRLDRQTPDARRTLAGDDAMNRLHLPSGAGEFRIAPMTAMPVHLVLDVEVGRLRSLVEDDDLLVLEVPPDDAPQDYTPLRVRLPGRAARRADDLHADVHLWAKDLEPADVMLMLPGPDDPVEGPMRATAPTRSAPQEGTMADAAGAQGDASTPPPGGTDADDLIDATGLREPSVLSGGGGADVYTVRAGQSLVIDNMAVDRAQDLLRLVDIDERALLDGIRFSRSGDDLAVDLSGGRLTLRNHASQPHARHLSLQVGQGRRFTLPIAAHGAYVHRPRPEEAVIATAPGTHLVTHAPDTPWVLASPARTVHLTTPAKVSMVGRNLQIECGPGPAGASIILMHKLAEARDAFQFVRADGTPFDPLGALDAQDAQDALGLLDASDGRDAAIRGQVAGIIADLRTGAPAKEPVYPVAAVRAYLREKGLPAAVVDRLPLTTFDQLQRVHRLCAAAVTADQGVTLSADFIDGYARSTVDTVLSADRHGALLRKLAARGAPWPYVELVLTHDLTPETLSAYESWAATHLDAGPHTEAARLGLQAFAQMLAGRLPSTAFAPSLLSEVLRMKGRPEDMVERLAAGMMAIRSTDDDWVAGMLRAGIEDPAALRRLWREAVTPQEVMLSNARRRHYEGWGDRTSLVEVSTSASLQRPAQTTFRYFVKQHLKLDRQGNGFVLPEKMPGNAGPDGPHASHAYDLVPGEVFDAEGRAPSLAEAQANFDRDVRSPLEAHAASGAFGDLPAGTLERYLDALWEKARAQALSGSSLRGLVQAGLVDVRAEKSTTPAWQGRSHPSHLVDGIAQAGEAMSWRPFIPSETRDGVTVHGNVDLGKDQPFIRFDFADPIALTRITLKTASSVLDDKRPDRSQGRWAVQALSRAGAWLDVAPWVTLGHEASVVSATLHVEGVPYRSYRLAGVDGRCSRDTVFTEIGFGTGEAGAGPVVEALEQAGYTRQDTTSLLSLGVRSPEQVGHAVSLRSTIGQHRLPMPLVAAYAREERPPDINVRTWAVMRQRAGQGESPAAILQAMRDAGSAPPAPRPTDATRSTGPDRQGIASSGDRINAVLDRLPASLPTGELLSPDMLEPLRCQIRLWLSDTQPAEGGLDEAAIDGVAGWLLRAASGERSALREAIALLAASTATFHGARRTVDALAWGLPSVEEWVSNAFHEGASRLAHRDASVDIVAHVFSRLLDTLEAQVRVALGDDLAAERTSASQRLVLAALGVAAADDQDALVLDLPTSASASHRARRQALSQAAPDLERLHADGILKVSIVSTQAPRSAPASWTRQQWLGEDLHRTQDLRVLAFDAPMPAPRPAAQAAARSALLTQAIATFGASCAAATGPSMTPAANSVEGQYTFALALN